MGTDPFYKQAICDYDIPEYISDPYTEIKKYNKGMIARDREQRLRKIEEELKKPRFCKLCGDKFFATTPSSREKRCKACRNLIKCPLLNFYCIACFSEEPCKSQCPMHTELEASSSQVQV